MTTPLQNFRNTLRASESVLVEIVALVIPWLAPIAPVAIAYQHMTAWLLFHPVIAGAVGVVLEGLEIAIVYTALAIWRHNRIHTRQQVRKGKVVEVNKQARVPLYPMGIAFGFYLAVLLSIVIIPELPQAEQMRIVAKALLALLSIPAALVLALRALMQDIAQGEAEAQAERKARRKPRQAPQAVDKPLAQPLDTRAQVLDIIAQANGNPLTQSAIAKQVGTSRQNVSQHIAGLVDAGELRKEGRKYVVVNGHHKE